MFGRRSRKATIALAGLLLVAASCIADDPDPFSVSLQPGDDVVVAMSEFKFKPRNITVVAGSTVTITLANNGFAPHEFMVGSQTIEGGGYSQDLLGEMLMDAHGSGFTQAGLALQEDHAEDPADDHDGDPADDMDMDRDLDMDMDEGGGGHGHQGAAITVEPGGEVTLQLNIPSDVAGDWEIGCFIEGHYEAGMHGSFTVSQPNT